MKKKKESKTKGKDKNIERGKTILATINKFDKEVDGFVLFTKGKNGNSFQIFQCNILDVVLASSILEGHLSEKIK